MSNDYTLPPKTQGQPKMMTIAGDRMELEEGDYIDFGHWLSPEWCEDYGKACAEAARAPLAEENARLKARVAELDSSESQLIEERDHAEEIIDKLCDEVLGPDREEWSSGYFFTHAVEDVEEAMAGLRAEVEALRNSLRECELFVRMEGLNSEPAAKASEHARSLLAQPSTPWVNPLAAELEALRADAERLSRFESWAGVGLCPTLLFDDDGHWFVSFDGFSPVGAIEGIHSSFATGEWHDTVRAAIDAAGVYVESEFEHIAARKGEGSEG